MKRFIKKLAILVIITSIVIGGYCHLADVAAAKYYGANTEEQIKQSFRNSILGEYNCYFLGNSRIYRGINPEKFTSVHAYNFGHDNDTYNQMYYKLLYLLQNNKKMDYVIIGTDYFQFSFLSSTRNYVYGDLLSDEYLRDYPNTDSWYDRQVMKATNVWENKQNAFYSVIKYICGWPEPQNVNCQKENGQYVVHGHADGDEIVDRDYSVLDIQYEYFERIISLCESENIELYVIMPPLWEAEVATHTSDERDVINDMILEALRGTAYEGNYINFSEIEGLSSYKDFTDGSHLTLEAADRFSVYIDKAIFGR